MAKLARGAIVRVPDAKWISDREWKRTAGSPTHAKTHRTKGIVLQASSKTVVLCHFNPGEKPSRPGGRNAPWISKYATGTCHGTWKDPSNCVSGYKVLGKAKRVPAACNRALKEKQATMKRYGGMSTYTPTGFQRGGGGLDGAKRRKRRR